MLCKKFLKIVHIPKNHVSYIIYCNFFTWNSFENIIKLRKHILRHTWSFLDKIYVILRAFFSFGFAKLFMMVVLFIRMVFVCTIWKLKIVQKKPLKNLLLLNPDPCTILDKLLPSSFDEFSLASKDETLFNLFVTSKNETTNSSIHQYKVLQKDQRIF